MTDLRPIYFNEARARLVGNRLAVYDALMAHGPATGSELSKAMGWQVTSCRPRLTELRAIHAAIETGIRRNGEHEFRALTAAQMQAANDPAPTVHEHAECNRNAERLAEPSGISGQFRELKQLELCGV